MMYYRFEKLWDEHRNRYFIDKNRCIDCYWQGTMGTCINEKELPGLTTKGKDIKLASKGIIWSSYYAIQVAIERHLKKGCKSFICPTWKEKTILRFYHQFKMQKQELWYIEQLENKYRQETKELLEALDQLWEIEISSHKGE